ncbi:EF-hand domain-containing protein [Sphingomonas sp. PAMC 26617]|uniref:EF-hand domain-containing protein n=1 Tax=Sphingomonas sp. PAMC 26617 TaxID=1112216 RepID=UPI00028A0033|nr:EF-hand domain-containing protein [Sphingomonas sp. PAMC 26617]
MFKSIVIASAVLISAPVFGQTTQPAAAVPPGAQQGATNIDANSSAPSSQGAAPAESTPAQTTTAQAASGAQVAEVVGTEFPTYDKDGDGALSAKEFGAWMVTLKTASDPSTKATAPATKTWIAQAFAQADVDKNRKVSKGELTTFLSAAA